MNSVRSTARLERRREVLARAIDELRREEKFAREQAPALYSADLQLLNHESIQNISKLQQLRLRLQRIERNIHEYAGD
jgi:hypothetical protein